MSVNNYTSESHVRERFFIIDIEKEPQIARLTAIACTIIACEAAYVLLSDHKDRLFHTLPARDQREVKALEAILYRRSTEHRLYKLKIQASS